jgi:hypothetical protein
VCPIRDVAHATPQLAAKTLDYLAAECDGRFGKDAVDAYAACVQRFIRMAADPDFDEYSVGDNPHSAYARSGLAYQPEALHAVYADLYMRMMFTFYFNGVREALHPGEKALGLDELLRSPIRRSSSLARWIRRLFSRRKKAATAA